MNQIATKTNVTLTKPNSYRIKGQKKVKAIQTGKLCTSATRRRMVLHPIGLSQTSPSTICRSKPKNKRVNDVEVRTPNELGFKKGFGKEKWERTDWNNCGTQPWDQRTAMLQKRSFYSLCWSPLISPLHQMAVGEATAAWTKRRFTAISRLVNKVKPPFVLALYCYTLPISTLIFLLWSKI